MNIRIEDLFYIYEGSNESVVALRGLHLEVKTGECLVIMGPNGSGKSTLVKLLTGFYTATAGKIFIGDDDITRIDPLRLRREFVSSIDQRGNLLADITIVDNIALAYTLIGQSLSESRRSASELLATHGLEHLSGRYQDQLSAGERQFSSLLTAIATNPKVLIADEPSGELDNESAEVMYKLLKSIAGNASVILVTHDSRAERYADRVVRIREGRVSEEWLPGEAERSIVDPFGWMRVREVSNTLPHRSTNAPKATRKNLVKAVNLGLVYGNKEIFSQVNINGASGELIALSSTSGSGKSSLLRILCGIQNPSSGDVHVHDHLLGDLSREERANLRRDLVGFLSQGSDVISNISLADHWGLLKTDSMDSFDDRKNRPLATFSGGERARIELIRILAEGKPILLLDEPTSQMDEQHSLEAAELLLDYVGRGGLVIASTKDELLLRNADQVIRGRQE